MEEMQLEQIELVNEIGGKRRVSKIINCKKNKFPGCNFDNLEKQQIILKSQNPQIY